MAPVHYHEGSFPPENIDLERLIGLVGSANGAIARYDAMLEALPNADILLSPLTTQEAVLSSKIEGTQVTMGEVLEYEAKDRKIESMSKEQDIQEIQNYRRAMKEAEALMATYPLSNNVLRKTHCVLMEGVRGQTKAPGTFRRICNWIGKPGSTIATARFVPIGADKLPDAMSSWESYIHDDTGDNLLRLAVLHAEFEAIHPFLDGNGRLGRMFVPLFLADKNIIRRPMFYISAFLEANRQSYYDALLAVSRDHAWTEWCEFFLTALQTQAEDNLERAIGVLERYNDMKERIVELTHSQHAIRMLDWMFEKPIFKSSDFVSADIVPRPTAQRMLKELKDQNVLREIRPASGRRSSILAYAELLNFVEGRVIY